MLEKKEHGAWEARFYYCSGVLCDRGDETPVEGN